MSNFNIEMVQNVAKALGDLKDQVVFVGGASVSLYLDLTVAEEVRPTEDVDVIIEIVSGGEYQELSMKLLKMKFNPDQSIGAPLCRWKYLGMTIDIMPIDEKVLGFSNQFYKKGIKKKMTYKLPDGQSIFVLPLDLFLATKLEAFFNRGLNDPRMSSDLEDLVALLLDAKDFNSILTSQNEISYIRESFKRIFNDRDCLEAIEGFAPTGTMLNIKNRAFSI